MERQGTVLWRQWNFFRGLGPATCKLKTVGSYSVLFWLCGMQ